MKMPYIKKEARDVEKAISFLVKNINKTGRNSKPVILHSLQVAFYLLEKEYSKEVVISAILHDTIEDSAVTLERLAKKFGSKIALLVGAVSYDSSIEDWENRYKDMFRRVEQHGKEALILKCSDILYNSFYICLVEDFEFRRKLVDKIKYFLDLSKDTIKNEKVWQDLDAQYKIQFKKLGK